MFLHMKHPLRKGGKLSLLIREAVLSRGQKDTFLVACGLSLYFLQVSQVGGGRKGDQWNHGNIPSLHRGASWSLSMIFCSEVCFGSDYNVFFPACASVTGLNDL